MSKKGNGTLCFEIYSGEPEDFLPLFEAVPFKTTRVPKRCVVGQVRPA
jgi:hypothetical protein